MRPPLIRPLILDIKDNLENYSTAHRWDRQGRIEAERQHRFAVTGR